VRQTPSIKLPARRRGGVRRSQVANHVRPGLHLPGTSADWAMPPSSGTELCICEGTGTAWAGGSGRPRWWWSPLLDRTSFRRLCLLGGRAPATSCLAAVVTLYLVAAACGLDLWRSIACRSTSALGCRAGWSAA